MVRSQVHHQPRIALWNQIHTQVHTKTSEQVRFNVRIQPQAQVWLQVWDCVDNQAWDELIW